MVETADPGDYFTDLAGVYAGFRPSYPRGAIDAALDGLPTPARVVDVGCGTGISTRLFAAADARVTGIDPNAGMLAEAGRQSPDIPYRQASAETLPLPDASAELIVCAQAFHWFEPAPALAEFRRVLVPGGRLALLWNVRDTDDALSAAYQDVVVRAQHDAASRGLEVHTIRSHRPVEGGHFEDIRVLEFNNPQRLDWPGLLGRIHSASYFPRAGALKDELEAVLRTAFDRHAQDGTAVLAQRTELTLARAVRRRD